MNIQEYQRHIQITGGGATCPAIAMENIRTGAGTILVLNGSGQYDISANTDYYMKIEGTPAIPGGGAYSPYPVLNSVSPAWTGTAPSVIGGGGFAGTIYIDHSATGVYTYTFDVSWDDGTCTRVGTFDVTFNVT